MFSFVRIALALGLLLSLSFEIRAQTPVYGGPASVITGGSGTAGQVACFDGTGTTLDDCLTPNFRSTATGVGVGIAAPTVDFHVVGDSLFQSSVDSVTGFQIKDTDGGDPVFNCDTVNERCGIGTAAPAALAHFFGVAPTLLLESSDSGTTQIEIKNSTKSWVIGQNSSEEFRIRDNTQAVSVFTIDSATRSTGIGPNNITPVGTLEVIDETAVTGDSRIIFREGPANALNLVELQSNAGATGIVFPNTITIRTENDQPLNLEPDRDATAGVNITSSGGWTHAAGTKAQLTLDDTYAPASGTGVSNWINLAPTVNQTGGANGITRGLFINPTLTAAADFRALEIALGGLLLSSGGTFGTGTGIAWGDGDTECVETADDVWQCTTAGTANGFQLDATGDLTPIGTGTILASTGDSATGFFSTGQIEAARGGTGIDSSALTGIMRTNSGTWSADAGISHLAASSSADLIGVLSDPTGTLLAVFSDAPTFSTSITVTGKISADPGGEVDACEVYTVAFTDLTTASTTEAEVLFNLPARGVVRGLKVKHSVAFTGTGPLTAMTVSVGDTAGAADTFYTSTFDVFAAVSNILDQDTPFFGSSTFAADDVQANFIATGGNMDDLTAGSVDFMVCWAVLP